MMLKVMQNYQMIPFSKRTDALSQALKFNLLDYADYITLLCEKHWIWARYTMGRIPLGLRIPWTKIWVMRLLFTRFENYQLPTNHYELQVNVWFALRSADFKSPSSLAAHVTTCSRTVDWKRCYIVNIGGRHRQSSWIQNAQVTFKLQ